MKKYYILIVGLITLGSCSKWLDVKPKTEISASALFQTEEGFQEALNGVYTRCAKDDTYGGELSFGLLDVLAQNYTINSLTGWSSYREIAKYNYKHQDFIDRRDMIWGGLYSAIANANLILANIDAKQGLFTGNNYAVIKGEALALRAYLHFDLYRMFGSSFAAGGDITGIPYVMDYSNKTTPVSNGQEVVRHLIEDLTAAKQLLASSDSIRSVNYKVGYPFSPGDPLYVESKAGTETGGNSLFTQNRRHRLNYFAVCGELARVYLYKGDYANALTNAKEVIDSKKFPFTDNNYFITSEVRKKDLILYNELVFGWYVPKSLNLLNGRFQGGTQWFYFSKELGDNIYEQATNGAEDLRYKQWFQFGASNLVYLLQKYKRNEDAKEDDQLANIHPLMAPAIRLSEMYYIAAESSFDTDPVKAREYLNTVRAQRAITNKITTDSKTEFVNELIKEARKEFYGESQIFYMYKRLNQPVLSQESLLIPPTRAMFVFPLPTDEIEFGGR